MWSPLFLAVIVASLAIVKADDRLPKFAWSTRQFSADEKIPYLNISFPDGSSDVAILKNYDPAPHIKSRSTKKSCILKGRLQDESKIVVTITGGCPNEDTFNIILSSTRLSTSMYRVINSKVEAIPSAFSEPLSAALQSSGGRFSSSFVGHSYDNVLSSGVKHYKQKLTAGMAVAIIPISGFGFKLKIYYDQLFQARFGADSSNRVKAVVGNAQAYFNFPSFPIPMNLVIVDILPVAISISGMTSAALDAASARLVNEDPKATHAYIFITYHNITSGIRGIAYNATVCGADYRNRSSLVEYFMDDVSTAQVISHELGHNLGMNHDFLNGSSSIPRKDSFGNNCTGIGGVMDYDQPAVTVWSTCSLEDFYSYFDLVTNAGTAEFCLDNLTPTPAPVLPPVGTAAPPPPAASTSIPTMPATTQAPISNDICRAAQASCTTTCTVANFSSDYFCRASRNPVTYCRCSMYKTTRSVQPKPITSRQICASIGEGCVDVCASVGFHNSFGCQIITPSWQTCRCSDIRETFIESNSENI